MFVWNGFVCKEALNTNPYVNMTTLVTNDLLQYTQHIHTIFYVLYSGFHTEIIQNIMRNESVLALD